MEAGVYPLTEANRTALVQLLMTEPAVNLYMLGNLETLGFGREFCQFWGDLDSDGVLRGVLNRYMNGWAIYGRPTAEWAGLIARMERHPITAMRLQDNPGGVDSVLPWLSRYRAAKVSVEELMALPSERFQPQPAPPGFGIRRATVDDLQPLIAFYADAGHMRRSPSGVERPLLDTRVYVAEVDGTIASAALTNAETADLAMIGGVYTPPEWRGRGLSQAVCSALCADLIRVGKRPTLYWETPAAGAVYRKLGFERIGDWRSVWLEEIEQPPSRM